MKPKHQYQYLKEVAEKFNISVSEHNFCISGIQVKSGLCIVKGQKKFIMDKHKPIYDKIEILATCLANFPLDDVYLKPDIRELLDKFNKKQVQGKFNF